MAKFLAVKFAVETPAAMRVSECCNQPTVTNKGSEYDWQAYVEFEAKKAAPEFSESWKALWSGPNRSKWFDCSLNMEVEEGEEEPVAGKRKRLPDEGKRIVSCRIGSRSHNDDDDHHALSKAQAMASIAYPHRHMALSELHVFSVPSCMGHTGEYPADTPEGFTMRHLLA